MLEVISDQLKAIQEGQSAMADVPTRLNKIDDRLSNIENDVKAIKAAVHDNPSRSVTMNIAYRVWSGRRSR